MIFLFTAFVVAANFNFSLSTETTSNTNASCSYTCHTYTCLCTQSSFVLTVGNCCYFSRHKNWNRAEDHYVCLPLWFENDLNWNQFISLCKLQLKWIQSSAKYPSILSVVVFCLFWVSWYRWKLKHVTNRRNHAALSKQVFQSDATE